MNKQKIERVRRARERLIQRTPEEQLARLDAKFGPNNGAVKERIKLHNKKWQ